MPYHLGKSITLTRASSSCSPTCPRCHMRNAVLESDVINLPAVWGAHSQILECRDCGQKYASAPKVYGLDAPIPAVYVIPD